MTLYAVTVERSQSVTIFVRAETWEDAKADALELATDVDDWCNDTGLTVGSCDETVVIPRGHRVWSGGEDGEWVDP